MTDLVVNFNYVSGSGSVAGYNNVDSNAVGTLVADLLDISGVATGYGLDLDVAFSGIGSGNAGLAGEHSGIAAGAWNFSWYTNLASPGSRFVFTGLNEGDAYSLRVAGFSTTAGRDTDFRVNGGAWETYDNNGLIEGPTAPVTISGTVPANGRLEVDALVKSVYGYVSFAELTVTEGATEPDESAPTYSGPPVLVADSETQEGAQFASTASDETQLAVHKAYVVLPSGSPAPASGEDVFDLTGNAADPEAAGEVLSVDNAVEYVFTVTGLEPGTEYDYYEAISDGDNFAISSAVPFETLALALALVLDEPLTDTDLGTPVAEAGVGYLVLAGAIGAGATIVDQGTTSIVDGNIAIEHEAFDTADATFLVALYNAGEDRGSGFRPATVVDTAAE